jgi:hypothetical protein
MEKVLYVLWAPSSRNELAAALVALEPRGLQINVVDEDVVPAWGGRLKVEDPPMEGMVTVWLDSATARSRSPYEEVLAGATSRMAGYLVTESEPLPNSTRPSRPGERTWGFSQLAFLRRPEWLRPEEFVETWQRIQTTLAMETQSAFRYVQNVVARRLSADAPPWAGIVEECFPIEAMTDLHVFYDAVGDDERLSANMTRMVEAVSQFQDVDSTEVIWTSEYVYRRPW